MHSNDFDELIEGARQVREAFGSAYKEITGEDFDLESAMRHYPVVAVGLAAGLGAIAGWWVGRRTAPQLPPPPETKRQLPLDSITERLPAAMDRVRENMPDVTVSNEVKAAARKWFTRVVEPKIKENLDAMQERGLSGLIDGASRRLDSQREVKLTDPEASPLDESPGAEDLPVDTGEQSG